MPSCESVVPWQHWWRGLLNMAVRNADFERQVAFEHTQMDFCQSALWWRQQREFGMTHISDSASVMKRVRFLILTTLQHVLFDQCKYKNTLELDAWSETFKCDKEEKTEEREGGKILFYSTVHQSDLIIFLIYKCNRPEMIILNVIII